MKRRNWSVDCPELHGFVTKIHATFAPAPCRAFLLSQAAEVVAQCGTTVGDETDWHRRRREYFETVAAFDAELLDRHGPRESALFQEYERLIAKEDAVKLPKTLKQFLDVNEDGKGRLVPIEFSNGSNRLLIPAWGPVEFHQFQDPTPQFPSPGVSIEREYRIHEICFAFLVLHETDVGVEPFVAIDNSLRQSGVFLAQYSNYLEFNHDAAKSWIPGLELLLPRVESEFLPSGGESVDPLGPNDLPVFASTLHREMDVDAKTWNKYAKAAGVEIPKKGERNYKFSSSDAIKVLHQIAAKGTVSHRDRATELLKVRNEIELKWKDWN